MSNSSSDGERKAIALAWLFQSCGRHTPTLAHGAAIVGYVVSASPMDLHRFLDGVITSSSNLTRLRNEATALRNRQEFQRSQLTELQNANFESSARESFEIATKFAYHNEGRVGSPRGSNMDCTMVAAAPVLPGGYVVSASRIADRRMILAGYRLADLLTRAVGN